MSTPAPRQPSLSPSMSRQLASLWAPLWPGNRALIQAAWNDPEVARAWQTFVEAWGAVLMLAAHASHTQDMLADYAAGRLHDVLACLERQAPQVGPLFGPWLPAWLCAAAEYHCTGVMPSWAPSRVWQPTPEMRLSITPEGDVLGLARAPRQHRRWVERYMDLLDAPRPGRPSEPVSFENAEEFRHVMRRLMLDELRAGGKITEDSISLRCGVMRNGTRCLSERTIRRYCKRFGVEWGELKREVHQQYRNNPA